MSPALTFLDNANRYKIFQSGNLQIANVRPSDSGVYRCVARNQVTNETRVIPRKTTLKVYEPFGTKLPEIVYVPLDTNRVQIGANLSLECVANGAPVPLVSWEKFGGVLPDKRSQQVFGNLILTNVQPEDKGTYVCRAENGPGQATFKTALIDIFEAPTSVKSESTKTTVIAKRDETVELKCPIRSRPRADIHWFYQGRQIISTPSHHISIVGDKSILTIRNFLPSSSSGIYQCFGQNEYGSEQADLILIPAQGDQVQHRSSNMSPSKGQETPEAGSSSSSRKPMIIIGPQNTTLYEGESAVLVCYTAETASGSIQINWLQNDLIIEPTLMRRFEINQYSGSLRIVSIQKSDAGVYKCIASNENGVSSAEAYVQVKSNSGAAAAARNGDEQPVAKPNKRPSAKNDESRKLPASPTASRPTIQQIGVDKILLKWSIVDSSNGKPILDSASLNLIAYFKVDYRSNKHSGQSVHHPHHQSWLTIDEKIDPKKREYILTDLSKHETYSFRITTYLLNGEFSHGQKSLRFKVESTWSPLQSLTAASPPSANNDLKLSQIQVQIAQIWAISTSSLGLKWKTFPINNHANVSQTLLLQKINGFYIYYRKLSTQEPKQDSSLLTDTALPAPSNVPLFNFTRIKVPISVINEPAAQSSQLLIDTYVIANLEPSTQYEIKMTCYNLNGDLCSFSNTIFGLTSAQPSTPFATSSSPNKLSAVLANSTGQPGGQPGQAATSVVFLKSKQNEILFMILGIVLGILVLLLVIFVVMCIVRHRQHKRLLAQLHNTSQKLTSSSCPTLIYEDSLRQSNQNQLRNLQNAALLQASNNYTTKLIDPALFANYTMNTQNLLMTGGCGNSASNGSNDSNSTNSQSMSTTTSSMTTPPTLHSAQTNAEMAAGLSQAHHILLLNNANNAAAVSATLANLIQQGQTHQPPPIPQVPPPTMGANGTLNRININLNPLNGYLDNNTTSFKNQQHQNNQENFYHTLTTMGNLPNSSADFNEINNQAQYSEYNNTTLNIRAHLLLKQQQQQQQMLMNTLKAMNLKHQLSANGAMASSSNEQNHLPTGKSPSAMSMRRNNSVTSSKKSKKSSSKHNTNNNSSSSVVNQQQQSCESTSGQFMHLNQAAAKNYYLLPNLTNATPDLMTLGAALNTNPLGLIHNANNLFLLNQHHQQGQTQSHYQATSTFMPQQQFHLLNDNPNNMPLMFMNLFDASNAVNNMNAHQMAAPQTQTQNDNEIYESSLSEIDSPSTPEQQKNEEEEPMLVSHYAASGLLLKSKDESCDQATGNEGEDATSKKRTKNHEELQVI